MSKTVLLTGITGFIAKRIAHDLLKAGHRVRGTLRNMNRADEVRAAVGHHDPSQLEFVTLDLLRDDGWAEAAAGVDVLMHTASPFPMSSPKDPEDLIRPAVDGTLHALHAAHSAGIERVILTSSIVAIVQTERPAGHKYGPEDWTDPNHPTAAPYHVSKTMAEQAAWEFVKSHPNLKLTTINPSLVLGTPMDGHYGTSLRIIERILAAKDPMQPNLPLSIVDVKDVSALHLLAMDHPETAGQRIIAAGSMWTMPKMAEVLARAYPERKIKTKIAPMWLMRGLSLFDPAVKTILPSINHPFDLDTSATTEGLGFRFTDGRQSILDSAKAVLVPG